MTDIPFSLIPFPDSNIPEIQIVGTISRHRSAVEIRYNVTGDVANIHFPEKRSKPERKDDLWKATCFEIFIALPNQPQYWEYNLSPSGDWNVYRMDAYRRVGFREEPQIQRLPFFVLRDADCISIEATLELSKIISDENQIRVGITSVIQTHAGHETYWALAHPNSQADFHLRESFTLALEA